MNESEKADGVTVDKKKFMNWFKNLESITG